MLYLVAVILLNTYVFSVFKLFPKYGINALQAIAVNYWACVVTGIAVEGNISFITGGVNRPFLFYGALLGILLIVLFNILSYSTKKEGMAVTTIANKLSLVIPVIFSYWLYHEHIGWLKLLGIAFAFPAVYLSSMRSKGFHVHNLLLPLVIFIGSGTMDTFIKYVQHYHLTTAAMQAGFTTIGFFVAALLGSIVIIMQMISRGIRLQGKNILAGILLGIPNYFSVYYFVRLLDSDFMQSSAVIPVNNIGIVCLTTLTAIFIFKERANKQMIAGVVLSLLSIILIAVSDIYGRSISI